MELNDYVPNTIAENHFQLVGRKERLNQVDYSRFNMIGFDWIKFNDQCLVLANHDIHENQWKAETNGKALVLNGSKSWI